MTEPLGFQTIGPRRKSHYVWGLDEIEDGERIKSRLTCPHFLEGDREFWNGEGINPTCSACVVRAAIVKPPTKEKARDDYEAMMLRRLDAARDGR